MTLRDKIQVETLDEMTLARVERAVVADYHKLERAPIGDRPRLVFPALAAAAALVLLFVGWRLLSRDPAEGSRVASVEQTLELKSGADKTSFSIGRAEVTLAANSDARVVSLANGSTRIELGHGRVDCEVEPYEGRPLFLVSADDVVVEVVGTVFAVENEGGVRVEVSRGKVRVKRGDQAVMVAAGNSWGRSRLAASRAQAGPGDSEALATKQTSEKPAEGAKTREVSRGADKTAREEPKLIPRSNTPPKPGRNTEARPGAKAHKALPARNRSVSLGRPIRGLDPVLDIGASSARSALKKYRKLSLGRGAEAGAALYSLAFTELYRMRDARAALASTKRYESRFRRGKNAESLLWIRIAALCKQGMQSQCRAAAHSYSRRYPGGRFADSVADILNQIH